MAWPLVTARVSIPGSVSMPTARAPRLVSVCSSRPVPQPVSATRRPLRGPSAPSTALVSIRHAYRPHGLSNQAS
jgi:hypothetical protein